MTSIFRAVDMVPILNPFGPPSRFDFGTSTVVAPEQL
jgi:hypothetical protein